MYKPGDVSPEFPMHRIINVEPVFWGRIGRNVLAITLNGKYDDVHDTYYVPAG